MVSLVSRKRFSEEVKSGDKPGCKVDSLESDSTRLGESAMREDFLKCKEGDMKNKMMISACPLPQSPRHKYFVFVCPTVVPSHHHVHHSS